MKSNSMLMNLPLLIAGVGTIASTFVVESMTFAANNVLQAEQVSQRLASAAVPFVPNGGQWDRRAAFAAQTLGGSVFVTNDGRLVYSFPGKRTTEEGSDTTTCSRTRLTAHCLAAGQSHGWVLTESFIDAEGRIVATKPDAQDRAIANVTYFRNDASAGRSLPTFDRIDLGGVFPGVGVELRARGANVEKIFTLAAGRDPREIRLRLDGAQRLEIMPDGRLIAHTGNGPVAFTAPVAYQEDSLGVRRPVTVKYALAGAGDQYGFVVGSHDTRRPLVIDPLLQSTYIGGSKGGGSALAIHPVTGEVYVAGETFVASQFPGIAGGAQSTYGGNIYDAFISRYTADLKTLLQSTYLGGDGLDVAYALTIHPTTGDVYVAGYTDKNGPNNFPGTSGGAQPNSGPGGAAFPFISRLNSSLTTLIQSTYVGAGGDYADALAFHPLNGDLYVARVTTGTYGGYLTRISPDLRIVKQSIFVGKSKSSPGSPWNFAIHPVNGDVYVIANQFIGRYTADLTNLVQSNTLSACLVSCAIAIDPASGDVYAGAGHFVLKLGADLGTIDKSLQIGRTAIDVNIHAIAVHPRSGDVYVAGFNGPAGIPGTAGGAQPAYGGGNFDGFVSRVSADLSALIQSTYLGASGDDDVSGLAIDSVSGDVFVSGSTNSPGNSFPGVAGGAQTTNAIGQNGYVSRLTMDLRADPVIAAASIAVPTLGHYGIAVLAVLCTIIGVLGYRRLVAP